MSITSHIVITLAKQGLPDALAVMEKSLVTLRQEYDFGFRSYGLAIQLVFEGKDFSHESPVEEKISSAGDINGETIERLAGRYKGFAFSGSILFPDLKRLIDLDLMLLPTFDADRPACVLIRLESSLYTGVWNEDRSFNAEAAERLLNLIVKLGADDRVDGFKAETVGDLNEVSNFDGIALAQTIMMPLLPPEQRPVIGMSSGFVMGIKSSILATDQLGRPWRGAQVFETPNGFAVLNCLVDLRKK